MPSTLIRAEPDRQKCCCRPASCFLDLADCPRLPAHHPHHPHTPRSHHPHHPRRLAPTLVNPVAVRTVFNIGRPSTGWSPPGSASPTSTIPADTTASFKITLRLFDGRRIDCAALCDESIIALKVRLQDRTGLHRATQRLVFAGNTLKDADAVGTVLVEGAVVYVLALKTFPATLGPFKAAPTPLLQKDFDLPPFGDDFSEQGSMWIMEKKAAARHGVKARGVEFPICGQFSPPHPITLTDEEKQAIMIPTAATSFVFSYPVVAFDALEGGADVSRSFLAVGGYAYLDERQKIIATTTLMPTDKSSGGLQFAPPAPWRAEWTAALMRQGRFQRITIAALNSIGAHHFCWIRPGEQILGDDGMPCAEQPDVPHGGFAYLFHADVFNAREEERTLDRVFPIVSGDDYEAEDTEDTAEDDTEQSTTFALVSSLQQLQDLVDEEHASRGTTTTGSTPQPGGRSDELQGRINQLERQLDAATKCVACLVEEKDTVLEPCSHLCMCSGCAARVQRCPICRATVRARKHAFTG